MRLLLADTSVPGSGGSMELYADLVEAAVESMVESGQAVHGFRLRMSLPSALMRWLPPSVGTWLNHFWIMLTAARRVRRARPDLVHVLDGSHAYLGRTVRNIPVLVTLHDLIPLLAQSGDLNLERPSMLAQWLLRCSVQGLEKAAGLVCVSENSRQDLLRLTRADGGWVQVIHNPLRAPFSGFAVEGPQSVPQAKEKPFVLHVGHNAAYKNRIGVLRIFARIREQVDVDLVLAGTAPDKALTTLLAELDLEHYVSFVQSPDDAELIELYFTASLLLFPSLYEGFGWPPLEAMACGCPVVCSDAASLPEVVGDVALTASAADEETLTQHCIAVLTDKQLAESLTEKGRNRARVFTPEFMQVGLWAAYRGVLETPGEKAGVAEGSPASSKSAES